MAEIPLASKIAAGTAFVDVPLSATEYNMRAHVCMHNTQDVGGNPVLIYRHGGSGTGRDARLPFLRGGNGNAMFDHLLLRKTNPDDLHFTCISIQTPQNEHTDGVALTAHSEDATINWSPGVRTRPTNFPYNVYSLQAAILAIKARAKEWNIDPNRMFLMGTSYGSVVTTLSQLFPPLAVSTPGIHTVGTGIPTGSADSRVRGVIAHQYTPDFRSYLPSARGYGVHRTRTAVDWDNSTLTLTYTGAFEGMTTARHAGTYVYIYDGTNHTDGQYKIVDIVDDDNAVIDRSCGASASALSILISTETIGPGYIIGAYGRPKIDSNSEYPDLLDMDPDVRAAMSPQAYVESGNYPPWACPIFACTETAGNGYKPYGENATEAAGLGTQDVHDKRYITDWLAACERAGIHGYGGVFPFADWETEQDNKRYTASESVYKWMKTVISDPRFITPDFGESAYTARTRGK